MTRILLIRASEDDSESLPDGVDLLVTHEIEPLEQAIREAEAAIGDCNVLVVTSRTAFRILKANASRILEHPFESVLVAGAATGRDLTQAGVRNVIVPEVPGAAGIAAELVRSRPAGALTPPTPFLQKRGLSECRILWPRGSDADPRPFESLASLGAVLRDFVVYEKTQKPVLDEQVLKRLCAGFYTAVAVSSVAALDVLLSRVEAPRAVLPQLKWGVLGPATARAFATRGLPYPLIPEKPQIQDLIDRLMEGHP